MPEISVESVRAAWPMMIINEDYVQRVTTRAKCLLADGATEVDALTTAWREQVHRWAAGESFY